MSANTTTPGGVFVREQIGSGLTQWLKVYSYFYDGESYDYVYEVGPNANTEQQAEDMALVNGYHIRAQRNFLRDVSLKVMQ